MAALIAKDIEKQIMSAGFQISHGLRLKGSLHNQSPVASQSTKTVAIQAYLYVTEYATLFVAHLWPKLGGYFGHITICESGGHIQFFSN